MKIIPRKVHAILDYIVGILLIAAPWVLGFSENQPATMVPVIIGICTLVMSLMTNYELGAIKLIPFQVHMVIDVVAGAFLAVSPWLLGYASVVFLPHVIVGLLEIGAGLMTRDTAEAGHQGKATHA